MLKIPGTLSHIFSKYSISTDQPIVLAVSGGVDSMTLLHAVGTLGQASVVAYIDHGLRFDTIKDLELITKLASQYYFPVVSTSITLQNNNTEQEGREKRYAYLEQVRQEHNASWIITAHHSDDNFESRLLHLTRGSGLFGLIGIQESTPSRHLLRPLLSYSKKDIINYATIHDLHYNEDHTNSDPRYARNHLRINVIPEITKTLPDLKDILAYQGELAKKELERIQTAIEESLGKHFEQQRKWCYVTMTMLTPQQLRYALLFIIRHHLPEHTYTQRQITNLSKTLLSLRSGQSLSLNGRVSFIRSFESLFLSTSKDLYNSELPILHSTIPNTPYTSICVPKPSTHYEITYRRPGLLIRLEKHGTVYHKSIKKYFIELRIPEHHRREVPLLTDMDTKEVIALLDKKYYTPPTSNGARRYTLYISPPVQ